MEEQDLITIKESVRELLEKMTVGILDIDVQTVMASERELVKVEINVQEPQVLIGQGGQTLFELGRLLRIMLNKKLQKDFYLDLDINNYKKQKVEYLKKMATDLADQVAQTKEAKTLPPMPSYERRIIHSELTGREDVVAESQGEGEGRCVVVRPR